MGADVASWMDDPQPEDKISLELLLDWIGFVTFCICFWLATAIFIAFLVGVMTLPTPWQ